VRFRPGSVRARISIQPLKQSGRGTTTGPVAASDPPRIDRRRVALALTLLTGAGYFFRGIQRIMAASSNGGRRMS